MIEKLAEAVSGFRPHFRRLLPVRSARIGGRKSKNDGGMYERTQKTSVSLHPMFFLVGIFYSLTGELPFFIMTALVALEHELAHAFAAARLGYRLNKIVLMPYGAVIDGDLKDISLKDEIVVAVSGPLCNLFTAAGFAALWWFFPSTYPYTDSACFLSLSIAIVNLLPAYPLDGGRVLKCVLQLYLFNVQGKKQGEKTDVARRAQVVCAAVAIVISALLLWAFFALLRGGTPNYTILGFAFFLVVGAFGTRADARYLKVNFSNLSALGRGVEIRRVAVLDETPVKSALRYLCRGKYLILDVYDRRERYLGEVRQSDFSEFFSQTSIYAPLGEILTKSAEKCQKKDKIP